jgi:predicted chitinase
MFDKMNNRDTRTPEEIREYLRARRKERLGDEEADSVSGLMEEQITVEPLENQDAENALDFLDRFLMLNTQKVAEAKETLEEQLADINKKAFDYIDNIKNTQLKSKPNPFIGGPLSPMLTEAGVEQEVEKFVDPMLRDPDLLEIPTETFDETNKQTEEALTDAEIADIASSAIDDVGKAQDNQPNLDDAPTGGLMGKPPSKDLSELEPLGEGEPIINAYFNTSITGLDGNFSQVALQKALDDSVTNPYIQSLLKGTMDIEVGDAGPVEEELYYKPSNARKTFGTEDANRVLATLPTDVQARLNNGEDTSEDRNMYGIALADDQYDGGSAYKGRGLIQLTHRRNYQAVDNVLKSKGINIDLVNNPELALDDKYALPVALAYLEHVGLNNNSAENSSAKELNNLINTGASSEIAEERWGAVVNALENAGEQDKAEEMQLRNEYAAQRISGITGTYANGKSKIDGIIGPDSRDAMMEWLTENDVNIPDNATDMQLVVLVNRNS